jgi:hypothetical protein
MIKVKTITDSRLAFDYQYNVFDCGKYFLNNLCNHDKINKKDP